MLEADGRGPQGQLVHEIVVYSTVSSLPGCLLS
jgi:hypothetical protein